MNLLTTRNFNGIALDCYKGDDENDFWATREQIGRLLGYSHPQDAIAKIHRRNRERLDKFSRGGQIVQTLGGTQNATVYNFRGLLEICRWSNQPKADAVMDFLWEVADDIHKHGMYISDKLRDKAQVDPKAFEAVVNKYLMEKEKTRKLEDYIEKNRAYTLIGEIVTSLEKSIPIADASVMCAQHGFNIGRNRLYELLRNWNCLCSQKSRRNKPTQRGVEQGIVNLELNTDGTYIITTRTTITPKGMEKVLDFLQAEQRPLEALWQDDD